MHLALGPDGNLWFTNGRLNIGRMTLDGKAEAYEPPTHYASADMMVVGKDGNLWFNEFEGNKIGKVVLNTSP